MCVLNKIYKNISYLSNVVRVSYQTIMMKSFHEDPPHSAGSDEQRSGGQKETGLTTYLCFTIDEMNQIIVVLPECNVPSTPPGANPEVAGVKNADSDTNEEYGIGKIKHAGGLIAKFICKTFSVTSQLNGCNGEATNSDDVKGQNKNRNHSNVGVKRNSDPLGVLCPRSTCDAEEHYHRKPGSKKTPLQGAAKRLAEKVLVCKVSELIKCPNGKECYSVLGMPHYHSQYTRSIKWKPESGSHFEEDETDVYVKKENNSNIIMGEIGNHPDYGAEVSEEESLTFGYFHRTHSLLSNASTSTHEVETSLEDREPEEVMDNINVRFDDSDVTTNESEEESVWREVEEECYGGLSEAPGLPEVPPNVYVPQESLVTIYVHHRARDVTYQTWFSQIAQSLSPEALSIFGYVYSMNANAFAEDEDSIRLHHTHLGTRTWFGFFLNCATFGTYWNKRHHLKNTDSFENWKNYYSGYYKAYVDERFVQHLIGGFSSSILTTDGSFVQWAPSRMMLQACEYENGVLKKLEHLHILANSINYAMNKLFELNSVIQMQNSVRSDTAGKSNNIIKNAIGAALTDMGKSIPK